MTPEIEDALYSACNVTTKPGRAFGRFHLPNHPRAIGTFKSEPSSVSEFKAKLRAFLGEIDSSTTVGDLLDELQP